MKCLSHVLQFGNPEEADRSPVGQEIIRMRGDLHHLAMLFHDRGEIEESTLMQLEEGIGRLRMYGTLCDLVEELRARTAEVDRLVESLHGDQEPGAVVRIRRKLDLQAEQIQVAIESASA